jgi:hypothetical protein
MRLETALLQLPDEARGLADDKAAREQLALRS